MKCLVTGGAGFIGSYLCDRLLVDGNEVWCIDNLLTGSKQNILHLLENSNFHFVEHDCIKPLFVAVKPDIIFHFASPASPPKYQQYPLETLLVNSYATYLLLEMAKESNAIFLFASTSEIYGDPKEHPQRETYWGNVNTVGERACYDEAKRVGETFVTTYVRKFGLDGRIIRIFNTYGPRMDINDGRVITNFIKQILENSKMTIQGDGKQTRSFCYITDLIEGIMDVATDKQAKNGIFNLGNPEEITILELAENIKELTGYQGEFVYRALPSDDPIRRKPDISKIQKLSGWQPKLSLKEGLLKTLDYFKSNK